MQIIIALTYKQLEAHGCVLGAVANDALLLKHQATSIHCACYIFIVAGKFHTKYYNYTKQHWQMKSHFEK